MRTRTRSSAGCAVAAAEAISGRGERRCCSRRIGIHPRPCVPSTPARTARCAPPDIRWSASSTTWATRRRSPRSTRAARPESRWSCSWSRMRAAGCRAFARTPSASTSTRSRGYGTGERGSALPPTPSAPVRWSGWRRSGATPPRRASRCTFMQTSNRARSRSVWPSTALARSKSLPAPAVWDPTRPSCTRPTRARPSSTCSPRPAHGSASAPPPRPTSATATRPSPRSPTAALRSASAPTRTSGSTPLRSFERSKGSHAVRPDAGTSSPSMRS